MKKWIGSLIVLVGLTLGIFGVQELGGEVENVKGIKIASFNAQVFGDSKIGKVGVDYYVNLIREYDVLFLLEIRDSDASSFWEICNASVGYACLISERAGRSSSKEQVGVFYRADVLNVSGFGELDDEDDLFEREPVYVDFENGVRFYVLHLKPDDVVGEMRALEGIIGNEEGVILVGDLNADCSYYDNDDEVYFDSWVWLIGDDVDTTTGKSDCAYDRVIVNGVRTLDSGVRIIDEEVSDHHLVWVEI